MVVVDVAEECLQVLRMETLLVCMGSPREVQEETKTRLGACPQGAGVEDLEMKLDHHGAEHPEADG